MSISFKFRWENKYWTYFSKSLINWEEVTDDKHDVFWLVFDMKELGTSWL